MEEKIVVKNFSVIDNIEIDVKKINILIGPQAAGKCLNSLNRIETING